MQDEQICAAYEHKKQLIAVQRKDDELKESTHEVAVYFIWKLKKSQKQFMYCTDKKHVERVIQATQSNFLKTLLEFQCNKESTNLSYTLPEEFCQIFSFEDVVQFFKICEKKVHIDFSVKQLWHWFNLLDFFGVSFSSALYVKCAERMQELTMDSPLRPEQDVKHFFVWHVVIHDSRDIQTFQQVVNEENDEERELFIRRKVLYQAENSLCFIRDKIENVDKNCTLIHRTAKKSFFVSKFDPKLPQQDKKSKAFEWSRYQLDISQAKHKLAVIADNEENGFEVASEWFQNGKIVIFFRRRKKVESLLLNNHRLRF